MVGALWIDSGSDSDSDVAHSLQRRQRRSQDVNAVAGPSRLDAPQPRKSPRRVAAPPSSSDSVIALSSSQDHDQHIAVKDGRRGTTAARRPASETAEVSQATPGQHMAQLLAEPSPDTSLPSFRELLWQHKSGSTAAPTTTDASTSTLAPAASSRAAPNSLRAGSLRRTASHPTVSSSQEDPTSFRSSRSVRRPTRAAATIPEIIEIGSDSIVDPASEADAPLVLQTSSPIRSQFSARPPFSSSQPLPFSPPRPTAAARKRLPENNAHEKRGVRPHFRAESAPIVILSSSPPPVSLPRASQRSVVQGIPDIAEEEFDVPDLPPSSFPFEDPPPSPPFSPVGATEAVDTSPPLKRRVAESEAPPPPPQLTKRARGLNRTTSLLDALDKLYDQEDSDVPPRRPRQGNADKATTASKSGSTTAVNDTAAGTMSPSKAQKAAAAKQAREAKARQREAGKAAKQQAAAERKRFLEVNRLRTAKSETMCELIIDLDRSLFSQGQPLATCQESMTARFEEEGASVHLCDGVVAPPLVRFRRKVKAEWNVERRHWVPLEKEEVRREAMVIVYMDAKEVVQLVSEGGEAGLETWYGDLMRRLEVINGSDAGAPQVFLICQGLVKFYSRIRANENRAYTARIRQQLAENQSGAAAQEATAASASESAPKANRRKAASSTSTDVAASTDLPTQATVERSLLQLKLMHRCYVIHAASLVDGVEWLHQLTSDLSLKPYKSLRDTHLSFAVDTGRNTTSSSSAAIYSMMLQQIPRVTPSIANSITTIYPSLHALIHAYHACRDEAAQKALLSSVQVLSNKDGTERRANRTNLGLQLSKRIHAVIRGTNAELLINNPTKD